MNAKIENRIPFTIAQISDVCVNLTTYTGLMNGQTTEF
jgi:hypothetical protein